MFLLVCPHCKTVIKLHKLTEQPYCSQSCAYEAEKKNTDS